MLSEYRQANRHSKLRFFEVEEHNQNVVLPFSIWRLPIENFKIHPAYGCTADLESIEEEDAFRPQVVVAPLNWMHNPSQIFERDIYFGQRAYLDICQWSPIEMANPVLCNSAVMNIPDSNELRISPTHVEILLYQKSGQRIRIRIEISWNAATRTMEHVQIVRITRTYRLLGVDRERTTNQAHDNSRRRNNLRGSW
jgi:hypothetical protein